MSRGALITSSTTGLGLAIARSFAERGYDIMLNGPEDESLQETVNEFCQKYGVKVGYHGGKIAAENESKDLVNFALKVLGSIDVLINVCSPMARGNIKNITKEMWSQEVTETLAGAFYVIKEAMPQMLAQKFGRVITIASSHSLIAEQDRVALTTAMHGLVGLTKSVAVDCAPNNITANIICPGYVLTPKMSTYVEAIARERNLSFEAASATLLSGKHLTTNYVRSDAVANLALYLASADADQVTGGVFPLDAGWTAH